MKANVLNQPRVATLAAAQKSFDSGNTAAALNQICAFQNKVRAQVAPSNLALANEPSTAAQEIVGATDGH